MERNKNHSDSSFHYERTETTEESTSVPTEPCMGELQQLLSVTLERSHLDIRKLQQAANDFRLCAKTFVGIGFPTFRELIASRKYVM
jgi:hypothetical protein